MEMLSGASVDTFKRLVWITAFVIGLLFLIGPRVSSPLNIIARVVTAFCRHSGFCCGQHSGSFLHPCPPMDPRWSVGKDATLDSPELSAGPIFQPITDALNDILAGVMGGVNDVIVLKNAFLTMPDFISPDGNRRPARTEVLQFRGAFLRRRNGCNRIRWICTA